MEPSKKNLTGLSLPELETFALSIGEKKFRGRQLFSWIYEKKASGFAQMSNLAKPLRDKLDAIAKVGLVQLAEEQGSVQDDAIKFLFQLSDGVLIESVLITESKRGTCCLSTQAGCALKCAFCATGTLGFTRHLSAGEIVDQVLVVARASKKDITNIVLMGMGEPMLNYDAVIKACQLLNDANGLAIAARHIVISTVGIVPAIYRYADDGHPYRLAISLHSALDEKRSRLVPIGRTYPLPELMQAVRHYAQQARQHPTIEYVLLAGVNDGEEDAIALLNLLKGLPCKVNLIPYNAAISRFSAPTVERVDQFARWLLPLRAPVSVRWSKGADIQAACGQLLANGKTKRSIQADLSVCV